MWARSVSPLRSALIAKHMCWAIQQRTNDTSKDLVRLELWFETVAFDVLEQVRNLPTSTHIYPHLPTSPHTSPHLPTSPHVRL